MPGAPPAGRTVAACLFLAFAFRSPGSGGFPSDESITSVLGIVGQSVTLPCDVVPPSPNELADLVLWYRESLKTPFYSWDTRGVRFEAAKHWTDAGQQDQRARFRHESPSGLFITALSKKDEGLYRCRVDFQLSPTRISRIYLKVIVPPEKPRIFDETRNEVFSVVGPLREEDSLRLTCAVSGGDPRPEVTWWKSEALIDATYEVKQDGTVVNELHLKRLSREDARSRLLCQASNTNLTSSSYREVVLEMNFAPLGIEILQPRSTLSAGRRYSFTCRVTGSRPPARITWWKANTPLAEHVELVSSDGNASTSTLRITFSSQDDGRFLRCRGENPKMTNATVEEAVPLVVQYAPEVRLTLGHPLRPDGVQEGDDVYFECKVVSNPWMHELGWNYEGNVLTQDLASGVIVSNHTLVLQRISRSRSGAYQCSAANEKGRGQSNRIDLSVKYRPTCVSNETALHAVSKSEEAAVTCQVDSRPEVRSFRWVFNSSTGPVEIAKHHFTQEGDHSVLRYIPVTDMDYGQLLCWAANALGQQETPCTFQVSRAGKPEPLTSCHITNKSSSSIVIACASGYDGGLPQTFVMEVYDADTHRLVSNATSGEPAFTLGDLGEDTELLISLFAANSKGRSDSLLMRTATLKDAGKRPGPVEKTSLFSMLTVLVISVASVFVFLFLVSVVVMRTGKRRWCATCCRGNASSSTRPPAATLEGGRRDHNAFCKKEDNPDVIPRLSDLGSSGKAPNPTSYEAYATNVAPASQAFPSAAQGNHVWFEVPQSSPGPGTSRGRGRSRSLFPECRCGPGGRGGCAILIPLPPEEFQDRDSAAEVPSTGNSQESSV